MATCGGNRSATTAAGTSAAAGGNSAAAATSAAAIGGGRQPAAAAIAAGRRTAAAAAGRGGTQNRAPDRESRGPDFFEQGVKDDPKASQLFDPQAQGRVDWIRSSEEQQPPPAGQPVQPAGRRSPQAAAAGRPSQAAAPNSASIVISGDNPNDIEEVLEAHRAHRRRISAGYARRPSSSCRSSTPTPPASRTPSRRSTSGSCAAEREHPGRRPGGQPAATAGPVRPAAGDVMQQPSSLLMIRCRGSTPSWSRRAQARMPDIKKEIEKLDLPNRPPAGKATAFPLKKASAQTVATLIYAVLRPALSRPKAIGAEPDPRHRRRRARTPSSSRRRPADLEEIKDLIERLDTTVSARGQRPADRPAAGTPWPTSWRTLITQAITRGVAAPGDCRAPGISAGRRSRQRRQPAATGGRR